jgi:hypothetical protein
LLPPIDTAVLYRTMIADQHIDIMLVIAELGTLHSTPPSFPRWMQMSATFATILSSIAHHSENNFSQAIRGPIMLIARNPANNTFVNAFDYKLIPPQERPDELLCPGVNFVGTPCPAPVTPAAMSSKHKHPYFRVGRIDNHIDGCTEGATRIDSPDTAIITDDHKGQEAPRGPDRLVNITLRHPKSAAARTAQESTRTVDQPLAYHRSPATTTADRPLTFQCGIRKAALDYARGIINDDDTVKLGDLQGPASRFIFSADRLINAPFKGHAIITFGHILSLSAGNAWNTHFIRLRRSNGGPTKVTIMIGPDRYAQLRTHIEQAKLEPSEWMVIACGTITGRNEKKPYLDPLDGGSLYFQRMHPPGGRA